MLLAALVDPSHRVPGGELAGRGLALDIAISNVGGRGGPTPSSVMFWYVCQGSLHTVAHIPQHQAAWDMDRL